MAHFGCKDLSILNPPVRPMSTSCIHLEVSSPGLDRPLRRAADYERFAAHFAETDADFAGPHAQQIRHQPMTELVEQHAGQQ